MSGRPLTPEEQRVARMQQFDQMKAQRDKQVAEGGPAVMQQRHGHRGSCTSAFLNGAFSGVMVGGAIGITTAFFNRMPIGVAARTMAVTCSMFAFLLGVGSTMRGC